MKTLNTRTQNILYINFSGLRNYALSSDWKDESGQQPPVLYPDDRDQVRSGWEQREQSDQIWAALCGQTMPS